MRKSGLTKSRPHDRTTAHDRTAGLWCGRAVVRSEHANYDRRALIRAPICRYTVGTVTTAQTDRTLPVYALPQDRFNIQ